MLFLTLVLLLTASCFAAPANHLQERQKDTTYTITCLGTTCTDYPPTTFVPPTSTPKVPGDDPAKPTTTTKSTVKTTATPSTKKTSSTSSTSKYAQPPETTSSKTTKSTLKPTKTTTGETGPSSTRCPVPLYFQCGGYYDGKPWTGCSKCADGAKCIPDSDFYSQCVADDD